jgi:hypothetical protein
MMAACFCVMAGLVPAIHDWLWSTWKVVDGRDKPGHDRGRRA